jgi:hypothetical protein
MKGSSTVATHDGCNVGRPWNALVLEELDATWIKLKFDFTEVISNDLPGQGKGSAVPLLQRLPQPFRDKLEVSASLELGVASQLAALTGERRNFRRRRLDEVGVFDQTGSAGNFSGGSR